MPPLTFYDKDTQTQFHYHLLAFVDILKIFENFVNNCSNKVLFANLLTLFLSGGGAHWALKHREVIFLINCSSNTGEYLQADGL